MIWPSVIKELIVRLLVYFEDWENCENVKEPVHPFYATGLFLYPLKTSEYYRFSGDFRGYRKRLVTKN